MKKVLLDMDGVLFDLGHAMDIYMNTKHSELRRDEFFENLKYFAMQGGFTSLPKMKDADELVDYLLGLKKKKLIDLAICTSAGKFYEPISEVVAQKKRSLEKNFPGLIEIPFIATCSGKQKSFFANADTILIDDHHTNINSFRDAGGIGVQYDAHNGGFLIVKETFNKILGKQ